MLHATSLFVGNFLPVSKWVWLHASFVSVCRPSKQRDAVPFKSSRPLRATIELLMHCIVDSCINANCMSCLGPDYYLVVAEVSVTNLRLATGFPIATIPVKSCWKLIWAVGFDVPGWGTHRSG